MEKGYVYILMNPSLRTDILIIGISTYAPEERAKELSRSEGIPTEYVVAYDRFLPDCIYAEELIQKELEYYHFSNKPEFYVLPLKEAIQIVSKIADRVEKKIVLIQNTTDEIDTFNKLSNRDGLLIGDSRVTQFPPIVNMAILLLVPAFILLESGNSLLMIFGIGIAFLILFILISYLLKNASSILEIIGSNYTEEPYKRGDDRFGSDEDIKILCRQGKKIEAIKRVREIRGLELADAKRYVENLDRFN